MSFTSREIRDNTLGGFLKQTRLSQGWELAEVAKKIGIEFKYLEFLEADDFYKLPSPTYARGFLKRYAEFLKQDAEKIVKQWEVKQKTKYYQELFKEKKKKENISKEFNFKIVFVFLLVLLVFLYFSWSAKKVLFAPRIKLLYPPQDIVVWERPLIIKGKTDLRADVFINNQAVEKFENGDFSQRVDLLPGLNTIEISAQKKYSKKSIIYLRVVFDPIENSYN
ncbi:MAG: helix-turn-helix transcriptional regulator [Patescibacteria group bacterium]|jgi:transcriptional regulator with XRE-family HTH domain|nr:helix-turn-helix transcriptional regulator [Patescibacteria group bacterium]MDD5172965.1 helix-turn-helix transcriptional regulator [Patescibacteria group bacterium]